MSKPAARAVLDRAGHAGPINIGSQNVITGGAPSARKGDSFFCADPTHGGSGVITGGSSTAFINGRPAARQSNITDCARIPSPLSGVTGGAPEQIFRTSVVNTRKTGSHDTIVHRGGLFEYTHISDKPSDEEKFYKGDFTYGFEIEYTTTEYKTETTHRIEASLLKNERDMSVGDPDFFQIGMEVKAKVGAYTGVNENVLFRGEDGIYEGRWGIGAAADGLSADQTNDANSSSNSSMNFMYE